MGSRTIAITVLVAVLAGVVPTAPAGAIPARLRVEPVQHVDNPGTLFGEDQQLLAWAYRRFDAAGLELPDLDISFDPTLAECDGPGGRYFSHPTRPRLVICSVSVTAQTRRVVLHELAHAWEGAHLTATDRAAFQNRKGLPTWFSHDHPWHHRAGEHVADIVAWGLNDGPGRGIVGVAVDSCRQLAADFQFLTGIAPPAGLPADCHESSEVDLVEQAGPSPRRVR